jgi:hypothetical protein
MQIHRRGARNLDTFAINPRRMRNELGSVAAKDWALWLRLVERKRRLLARIVSRSGQRLPREFLARITFSSFRLEGLDVTESQVMDAILPGGLARRDFRTRQTQRLRNHVALLHRIESALRIGESLKIQTAVRWYTSISCGLSTTSLDETAMDRLDQTVRRINSPQLRLQPAVGEIARLHVQLEREPLVPGFGGILARLLLRYHLGRCGLPPVAFDPKCDRAILTDESRLLGSLLEMIDSSYTLLLGLRT